MPWEEWLVNQLPQAPEVVQTAAELILATGQRPAIAMRHDQFQGILMTVTDEKGNLTWDVPCPQPLRTYSGWQAPPQRTCPAKEPFAAAGLNRGGDSAARVHGRSCGTVQPPRIAEAVDRAAGRMDRCADPDHRQPVTGKGGLFPQACESRDAFAGWSQAGRTEQARNFAVRAG